MPTETTPMRLGVQADTNEATKALRDVRVEGDRVGAALDTAGKKGRSAFGSIIADIQHARRQAQTLVSVLLIPFGAGQFLSLAEHLVSPILEAIKKAEELQAAIRTAFSVANLSGTSGTATGFLLEQYVSQAKQAGVEIKAAISAAGAASQLGVPAGQLINILSRAVSLREMFGVEIPKAMEITAGAIRGDSAAMADLQKITGQVVQNAADVARTFKATDLAKFIAQHQIDLNAAVKAGNESDRFLQLRRDQIKAEQELLKDLSKAAPTADMAKAIEEGQKLEEQLRKIGQAADTSVEPKRFEDKLDRIQLIVNREIDEIARKSQAAIRILTEEAAKGGPGADAAGFLSGALQVDADAAAAAVRAKGDAQQELIFQAEKDRKIKQAFEFEDITTKSEEKRLRKQEQFIDDIAEVGGRVSNSLVGVWDDYDKHLIKSSQLTKAVFEALAKEFAGDLGKNLAKSLLTAIFTSAASSGVKGSSGTGGSDYDNSGGFNFEENAQGGIRGVWGGTPMSASAWRNAYGNAPRKFDRGGVVRRPTVIGPGQVAGESGEGEGIVPLKGGAIPVRIKGNMGAPTMHVTYQISAIDASGMEPVLNRSHKQLMQLWVAGVGNNTAGARDVIKRG